MEIVTMKRAIITAFAAIGLSSIAGVSFAETELSGAQLDNVTAAGGAYQRPSSVTLQKNSSKQYQKAGIALVQSQNSNQTNQSGRQNTNQTGQGGLIGVGGIQAANGNNVTLLKSPAMRY
jgi:hypothetical protein